MIANLRNFQLDRTSFWLGFLAALLLWWLVGRLRPWIASLLDAARSRARLARADLMSGVEVHHANDTLRYAQRLHLASSLFPLDDVLIEPRLLAPPPLADPERPQPDMDIVQQALPYLPDWPELASVYHARTLSLAEALEGGCRLVITGQPGAGKTVMLAQLASWLARRDPRLGSLTGYIPFLVHAADLVLTQVDPGNPQAVLVEALSLHASTMSKPRLPALVRDTMADGRAVLLIDGLDELPPAALTETVGYLRLLLEKYPSARCVAAASSMLLDGLPALGFVPLAVAAWDEQQRAAFIAQWSGLWERSASPAAASEVSAPDPALLAGWLQQDSYRWSPLELTLKVWGVYAGDLLGPTPSNAIETHMRRLTSDVRSQPIPKARPGAEKLALQMTLAMRPLMERKDVAAWLGEDVPAYTSTASAQVAEQWAAGGEPPPVPTRAGQDPITAPRILPSMLESGLLVQRPSGRLTFAHPVLAAYLAACALSENGQPGELIAMPFWPGRDLALRFLAARQDSAIWVSEFLDNEEPGPLKPHLLATGLWLRGSLERASWRTVIMRELALCLQDERQALALRARALAALVTSGVGGVGMLLRQSLDAPDALLRRLAALGLGALRDAKAFPGLCSLLEDSIPSVQQAAMLALVAIGDTPALEAVVSALLSGNDEQRRAAAEALGNHVEEGHPALLDGATHSDLLVRRAVVPALLRIRQPWAVDALKKMQTEDAEWVVKNAATQAVEQLEKPDPHIPRPLPTLADTPWLIAFASERGMGVSPGRPAHELMMQALAEGREEQRIAAAQVVARSGDETAVLPLYSAFYAGHGELKDAAFEALCMLAASGVALPSPMQYGLK